MLISNSYIQLNKQLHRDKAGFGCAGARWTEQTLELCKEHDTTDVLDYGAGKGKLAETLPFPIQQYDPATFPVIPLPANIVVSTDVLEHVEPKNLRSVLRHIAELTGTVAFLNISTRRANKSLKDGRNAHLIIRDAKWWNKALSEFFERIECVSVSPTEYNVLVYPINQK